jgi:argininosuccinate synthase
MRQRVVLAYSGGLDTSVAIPWLRERGYDVVAAIVDVGQPGDLERASERAGDLGAVEARLIDGRASFVADFVLPALRMNALYQGRYPLVSALSRPLIARVLTEVAADTGAGAVAHGCTGKGNDQVRFEVSLASLAPGLEVLAPVRDWEMNRDETIAYAEARRLPIETTRSSPYSIDENLWGRSIECGALEDPWASPPTDLFELTAPPTEAPSAAHEVVVGFEAGSPTSLDGELLDARHVIESVGKVAGTFGVGRVDMIEDRLVGIKSREVYEAPAALALITAHRDLEALVLERHCAREKRRLEEVWANLVYEGLWFSPLREAIDAFAASTQESVGGEVRLRFEAGGCRVTGRRSPSALYDFELATYDEHDAFDQADAAGFVHLWGLPARQWSKVQRRNARR